MFKTKVLFVVLLMLGLMGYTVYFFSTPSKRDYSKFQRLVEKNSAPLSVEKKSTLAKQKRSKIKKQLVFSQDQQRLEMRLEGDQSEMILKRAGRSLEFVEHMTGMHCKMQEKHADADACPSQCLREFKSKSAFYHYNLQKLTAEEVILARYVIPERDWVDQLSSYQPFMQGQLEMVELTIKERPQFTAHGFQAIIQDTIK